LFFICPEDLDTLQTMTEELFSGVVNKNVEASEWHEHPFGPDQLTLKGYIVPVKDLRSLNITFPIKDLRKYYKSAVSIHSWHHLLFY
jgi:insulysin